MSEIIIPASFTLQDVLAAIGARADADGFYSRAEWRARFGVSEARIMGLLQQAKRAGILDVMRATRESIDGTPRQVPVYRFKIAKE